MKKEIRNLVIGLVGGIVLTGGITIASTLVIGDVFLSPYNILVNGKKYMPELPILNYQDRTYVPLRELATLTGKYVDFNDDNIIIDDVSKEDFKDFEGNWYTDSETVDSLTITFLENNKIDFTYLCYQSNYYRVASIEVKNVKIDDNGIGYFDFCDSWENSGNGKIYLDKKNNCVEIDILDIKINENANFNVYSSLFSLRTKYCETEKVVEMLKNKDEYTFFYCDDIKRDNGKYMVIGSIYKVLSIDEEQYQNMTNNGYIMLKGEKYNWKEDENGGYIYQENENSYYSVNKIENGYYAFVYCAGGTSYMQECEENIQFYINENTEVFKEFENKFEKIKDISEEEFSRISDIYLSKNGEIYLEIPSK